MLKALKTYVGPLGAVICFKRMLSIILTLSCVAILMVAVQAVMMLTCEWRMGMRRHA